MDTLTERLAKVAHGFKPFAYEAEQLVKTHSLVESRAIACDLLHSDTYQVRCCAIFVLGIIAHQDHSVLAVLKESARLDSSWQVQEIIAKAFDQYCKDNGYEQSIPEIASWLDDTHPNVSRAVTEGLRIWTSRPYVKDHPEKAVQFISGHKAIESEYLRKSVGNSLRDIRKKHRSLVDREISTWSLENKRIAFTYQYVLESH